VTRRIIARRASVIAMALIALCVTSACGTIRVRVAMNRGVSYFKSKEYEKALEKFKEATQIDPEYPDAWLDIGLTYMELYEPGSTHEKDVEYAQGGIEAFRQLLKLQPENLKAKEYFINMCIQSGQVPVAIEYFLAEHQGSPNDLATVKTVAALYQKAGQSEAAIEWFEKAATLEPTNAEAWYSLGVACWARSYNNVDIDYDSRMALLDKGLQALEKAQSLKQDYFEAITYTSLSYRQKAQYDISPAQSVTWRQKADELIAKAMEIRNRQLAASVAAANRQAKSAEGVAPGTAPATPPPATPQ
jgi:tetratricopeptide (TPR) repeat protein